MTTVTNVYVDGFNLYYGALKDTRYKWLDLEKLCRRMLPAHQHELQHIKYFTARVRQRFRQDQSPARQDLYLRALKTRPCVSVIEGHFVEYRVSLPLADQDLNAGPPKMVEVIRPEEKRTDVALATTLLMDAWTGVIDKAVIITNDSDQIPAISAVKNELKLKVGVIFPTLAGSPSIELKSAVSFHKTIRDSDLADCLFPFNLQDKNGRLDCPAEWR